MTDQAELTVGFLIIVFLLAERALSSWLWSRERRELCNRLQSGTLQDYERHVSATKKVKSPLTDDEPPATLEQLTAITDGIPYNEQEARHAFNMLDE